LMRVASNLYVTFVIMTILITLIMLIHEHGRSLNLLLSSPISSELDCFHCRVFKCFQLSFCLCILLLFVTIINRIAILSFSVCALLLYRNATDVSILMLYLVTLLQMHITAKSL
jgi:hypothetical protein